MRAADLVTQFKTREAIITSVVLSLILLLDFSNRFWMPEAEANQRQWSTVAPVKIGEQFTSAEQVKNWVTPFLPKPEPTEPETEQAEIPAPPTPEQQLNALVEQGAHRIGADVVYLRGVLIEQKSYALLTLVDKSMQSRFRSLVKGEKLGDYQLVSVTPRGIRLVAADDEIKLRLFKTSAGRSSNSNSDENQ